MSRSIILAGNSSAAQFKPLEQSPAAPVAETSVRETDRQQELDMIALHGNGCEICANIR